MKKGNKQNKKLNAIQGLIFALSVVSLLFVGSLVINFYGGFDGKPTGRFESSLGENVKIIMDSFGSKSCAVNFAGSVLPGDTYQQNVNIKLPDLNLDNYVLRAKVYLNSKSGEAVKVLFNGFDKWVLNSDDYYYFSDNIYPLQNIGLLESITLPDDFLFNSEVIYTLIVSVELFSA